MNPVGLNYRGLVPQDMLEILTNGVFAFAMTIIVKNNIPFPTNTGTGDISFFISYVCNTLMDGISFVFTFIILGLFYILFFEIFRNIRAVDRMYVYLTFSLLLSIIFIPLTSLLWSISDKPVPYGVLFHLNILVSGCILLLIWRHASSEKRLTQEDVSGDLVRNMYYQMFLLPGTALVGLVIDGTDLLYGSVDIIFLYMIPIVLFVLLFRDT